MQQAADFLTECDRIHALVAPLDEAVLATPTAFKGWTISDVIGHLHVWNQAAQLSLKDEDAFKALIRAAASLNESSRRAPNKTRNGA